MKKSVLLSVLLMTASIPIHADTPQASPGSAATTTAPDISTPTEPTIDCHYKIPEGTKTIDQSLVLKWSEKAVTQAFSFTPASLDTQLQDLKNCFTEPGWSSFNAALQKSGNVEAMKDQNLSVSSMIDGEAQILEAKDNEWNITFPLQVVYQNDKEKVTQLLHVTLSIGRKSDGDLGINQMVATPRATQPTEPATDTSTNTPANTPAEPTGTNNATPSTGTPATNDPSTPQHNTDTGTVETKTQDSPH